MDMMNKFYQMKDFPSYQINRRGIIIGHKGVPLKPYKNEKGYMCVRLTEDGISYRRKVHRLVAMQFIRNRSKYKTHVHHIDRDKTNNGVNNLIWETPTDHRKHNKHPHHLTPGARKAIMRTLRVDRPRGRSIVDLIQDLSDQFNVSTDYLSNLCYLKQYKTAAP